FFSSRRRHTRSKRDWSSDVCSSDLDYEDGREVYEIEFFSGNTEYDYTVARDTGEILSYDQDIEGWGLGQGNGQGNGNGRQNGQRSEERRVGKEGNGWGGRRRERRKE